MNRGVLVFLILIISLFISCSQQSPVKLPSTQESSHSTSPVISSTTQETLSSVLPQQTLTTAPSTIINTPSTTFSSTQNSTTLPTTTTQTIPLPPLDAFMKGIYFADWAQPTDPPANTPTPPEGQLPRPKPPLRGLYAPPETDQSLKRLAATGANWIAVSFQVWQENISSTQITREPPRTATDSELQRVIDLAHSLGLRVLLMPLLHLSNDPAHGHIDIAATFNTEEQWQNWFASYRDMISHYATFAQEVGVDMLFIGNELGKTTHREADWRSVIQEVRQRFKGPITYDSLCGPFPNGEYQNIQWWDAVDYIGIGGYNRLTDKNDPTVGELKEAWVKNGYIASMENISKKFNKPVIISEIGYKSKDGTNQRPAGYYEDGPLDLQEQADCYQAAMEVISEQPWIKGIFWFFWFANPTYYSADGPNDKDFTPQGKPAEEVLKSFYLSQ